MWSSDSGTELEYKMYINTVNVLCVTNLLSRFMRIIQVVFSSQNCPERSFLVPAGGFRHHITKMILFVFSTEESLYEINPVVSRVHKAKPGLTPVLTDDPWPFEAVGSRDDPQRADDGAAAGRHGGELKRNLPGPRVSPGLLAPDDPDLHLLLREEGPDPRQVCTHCIIIYIISEETLTQIH